MSKTILTALAAVVEALKDLDANDQQKVLDGVAGLLGHALRKPVQGSSGRDLGGVPPPEKKLSLVEYLNEKQPTTIPQKIATFAAYRHEVERIEHFSPKELQPYFAKARLPSPKGKFFREFGKTVKLGWIHEDGDKSYVTQTGTQAVTRRFKNERE